MPFSDEGRTGKEKHLIVYASDPKGDRVTMGTFTTEGNVVEVKDEQVVVDSKVQPGQGSLKSFFKCSLGACVPAGAGCLYGGPSWAPCFCLWCGGGILACGALELFWP
jgi:hypothetical protein